MGVDYNDTGFIRQFGTYMHDGKSAERAADVIFQAVKEKSSGMRE
jgi:ABC-type transport system involved in cytochrome bd biosynthesis fused ATPase/permease subunit